MRTVEPVWARGRESMLNGAFRSRSSCRPGARDAGLTGLERDPGAAARPGLAAARSAAPRALPDSLGALPQSLHVGHDDAPALDFEQAGCGQVAQDAREVLGRHVELRGDLAFRGR